MVGLLLGIFIAVAAIGMMIDSAYRESIVLFAAACLSVWIGISALTTLSTVRK
jgi:hypothetical protein